ncbi:hypothetical protein D9M71_258310 [compost metagenome]
MRGLPLHRHGDPVPHRYLRRYRGDPGRRSGRGAGAGLPRDREVPVGAGALPHPGGNAPRRPPARRDLQRPLRRFRLHLQRPAGVHQARLHHRRGPRQQRAAAQGAGLGHHQPGGGHRRRGGDQQPAAARLRQRRPARRQRGEVDAGGARRPPAGVPYGRLQAALPQGRHPLPRPGHRVPAHPRPPARPRPPRAVRGAGPGAAGAARPLAQHRRLLQRAARLSRHLQDRRGAHLAHRGSPAHRPGAPAQGLPDLLRPDARRLPRPARQPAPPLLPRQDPRPHLVQPAPERHRRLAGRLRQRVLHRRQPGRRPHPRAPERNRGRLPRTAQPRARPPDRPLRRAFRRLRAAVVPPLRRPPEDLGPVDRGQDRLPRRVPASVPRARAGHQHPPGRPGAGVGQRQHLRPGTPRRAPARHRRPEPPRPALRRAFRQAAAHPEDRRRIPGGDPQRRQPAAVRLGGNLRRRRCRAGRRGRRLSRPARGRRLRGGGNPGRHHLHPAHRLRADATDPQEHLRHRGRRLPGGPRHRRPLRRNPRLRPVQCRRHAPDRAPPAAPAGRG